jgi:hypothetical protein
MNLRNAGALAAMESSQARGRQTEVLRRIAFYAYSWLKRSARFRRRVGCCKLRCHAEPNRSRISCWLKIGRRWQRIVAESPS